MSDEKKKRVPLCPDSTGFTPAFLRRMIAYFDGVDEAEIELIGNAGMWSYDIGTHYKHLIPKFENFFLNAEEGDPIPCSVSYAPRIADFTKYVNSCNRNGMYR